MKKAIVAFAFFGAVLSVGAQNNFSLEANRLYRQEFKPVTNGRISTNELSTSSRLAKISGMDIVPEWSYVGDGVYSNLLSHSIDINRSSYNYVFIAEIDTTREQIHPVTSVKYLQPVKSIDDCKAIAGSYYSPPLLFNPIPLYIHPTDGVPGKSQYRYEVTTRNYTVNGLAMNNVTYSDLFLQSSGHGYGMLSAGDKTIVKNVVFQGGGTHHSVIASGTVDRCNFLPGPNLDGIAMVFYKETANKDVCKITNSNFIDIKNPIFTHTGNDSYYQSLLIDNVKCWSGGVGDKGIADANMDSTTINKSFVEGYDVGYVSSARHVIVKNTIFKDCTHGIDLYPTLGIPDAVVSNCLITLKDKEAWNEQFGIRSNTNLTVNNSLIYSKGAGNATLFQSVYSLIAHHNIYISDVPGYVHVMNSIPNIFVSSDYNVFVLLRGSSFRWKNEATGQYIYSLSEWQKQTGMDQHSVLIDLRNSAMGLNELFTDPGVGNWTLTANATKLVPAGTGLATPPTNYPQRPDVDKLLDIVLPATALQATPIVIKTQLEVYPNPFVEIVNIGYPVTESAVLSVHDMYGRLVKMLTLPPFSSQTQINLVGLKTGTYYITWSSGKAVMTKTLVKSR